MNHLPSVAVIMSCYNGEKYIKEQVDSIIAQKNVRLHLFIRDDGSSDNTISILNQLEQQYSGLVDVVIGKNVGVGKSFWELLLFVKDSYDYYSFSDQDDIWLPNKLAIAVSKLSEYEKHLYFSNQTLIDQDGIELDKAYHNIPDYSFYSTLFCNRARGCTMVFDKFLYSLITQENRMPDPLILSARNHDFWIACVGAFSNSIIYDEYCTMLYRQHNNNVVGAYEVPFKKKISTKFRKINNPTLRQLRSKSAVSLYNCYPEYLKNDQFVCLLIHQKSIKNRIQLIKYCVKNKLYGKQKPFIFIIYAICGLV